MKYLSLHSSILTVGYFAVGCRAWVFSHQHPSHKAGTPSTTALFQLSGNKSSLPAAFSTEESTSRRDWFGSLATKTGIVAIASSSLCSGSLSAQAAELVSAKSTCDPTVSVWKRGSRVVYLLGTAHISSASADLAGQLVQDIHPKGVFVELDPKRVKGSGILAQRLESDLNTEGESFKPTSRVIVPSIQVPVSGNSGANPTGTLVASSVAAPTTTTTPTSRPNPITKAASVAVGNSIKGMYKKLDSAGFQAGEEFVIAIREGQKIGSDIVLGDRDVEVTLRRVTEGLAQTDIKALLNPDSELEQSLKELAPVQSIASSSQGSDIGDLNDEAFRQEFSSFVETMKAKENVEKIMDQLQRLAPALYQALVSERDAYMAAGLNGLDELETIVAVMGIAHVRGVEQNLSLNGWKAVSPICSTKK